MNFYNLFGLLEEVIKSFAFCQGVFLLEKGFIGFLISNDHLNDNQKFLYFF